MTNAREYFEQVRESVAEVERARDMLETMLAAEGARVQQYAPTFGGGDGDGMDKINRRIEFEQRLQRRVEEVSAMLDEATAILYGNDGNGGLAKLKGNRYADVLCMAYIQAMPWCEVAEVMRCSQSWCRQLTKYAFTCIDAAGFARLRNG